MLKTEIRHSKVLLEVQTLKNQVIFSIWKLYTFYSTFISSLMDYRFFILIRIYLIQAGQKVIQKIELRMKIDFKFFQNSASKIKVRLYEDTYSEN